MAEAPRPKLAVLFSVGMLVNSVFAASMLQSHTVGRALLASYDLDPYLVTGPMAVLIALVVGNGKYTKLELRRIERKNASQVAAGPAPANQQQAAGASNAGFGQGSVVDASHLSVTSYWANGAILGSTRFHVNHPPN